MDVEEEDTRVLGVNEDKAGIFLGTSSKEQLKDKHNLSL